MELRYLLGFTTILWTYSSCLERPVTYTADGCIWTEYVKTQVGNFLSIQSAVDLAECKSKCAINSNCRGIDWNNKSECRLLAATNPKINNTNFTHYDFSCITGVPREKYIGCYKLTNLFALQKNSSLTIDSCIKFCQIRNTTYAVMQGGSICSCLEGIDTSYSAMECNTPCSGRLSEFCGGQKGIYSIYAVCPIGLYGFGCNFACHCAQWIPCDRNSGACPNNNCDGNWTGPSCNISSASERYLGCHAQFIGFLTDRILHNISGAYVEDGYISDTCSFYCIGSGYSYIGLAWYGQCYCGNSTIGAKRSNESFCYTHCWGNENEICGGYNNLSAYSACPAGYYGNNCFAKCNCANNARCDYFNGFCPSGGCKSGWTGNNCNVRDCGRNNGDCSANQTCVQLNLNYASEPRCMCSNGYQQINQWNQCTDMDECQLGEPVCNLSNSYCVNSIGSYNCLCKKNYEAVNQTLCKDIDECTRRIDICNRTISNCTNTDGSYNCTCVEGYTSENATICVDVDECSTGKAKCDKISTNCKNTDGSHECNCKSGFYADNETACKDIDECSDDENKCDNSTSTCRNTIGDYACDCYDGYSQATSITCSKKIDVQTSTIVGAVIGSVLGLILIVGVALLFYFRRKRHTKDQKEDNREILSQTPDVERRNSSKRRREVLSIYPDSSVKSRQTHAKSTVKTIIERLADPSIIKEEFQKAALRTGDFSALGMRKELKKKNRFLNIIPYNHNRVILSRTDDDDDASEYINASYIQGYNESDMFIAAQGPRDESVDDFWRMIVEKELTLIVMITNLMEKEKKKCSQYWPELGQSLDYEDVCVTTLEEDSWPSHTVRRLRATTGSVTMEITQWHYVVWPDHGVPRDAKCFLNFHAKVRQQMSPEKYTLVHCSAGAGRTGAFIATDYLLEQEKAEHTVDFLGCLKKLRDERPNMIQAVAQYEFIHLALLKAFTIGNTTIPMLYFASKYQLWREKDGSSEKSMLEIQFKDIEETKAIDLDEAALHLVSSDNVSSSQLTEMDSIFINSWKRKDAFIWTKLLDNQENFWKLRKDKQSEIIIYIESIGNTDENFLPNQQTSIALKGSTLLFESESKEKYGSCCVVSESAESTEHNYENTIPGSPPIYQNAKTGSNKTKISVLRLKEPNGGKWTNVDSLRSLFNFIEKHRSTKPLPDFPIMIVSRCSHSVAGFLICILNAIEMLKLEKEIDLYQIVLNIRKSKPEFLCSESSYIDLHDVVVRYVNTTSV